MPAGRREALTQRRIARLIGGLGGGALRVELRKTCGQFPINLGSMIEGVGEGAAGGIMVP